MSAKLYFESRALKKNKKLVLKERNKKGCRANEKKTNKY